jgi:hypothetical protein
VKSDDSKKIVSVRVNQSDLEKIRIVAQRLRVRESKVLRFAIKVLLNQLGPLHDPAARGTDLMPVFADLGDDLTNYFQFDYSRLELIINGNLDDPSKRVDSEDIALVAVNDMPASYRCMKLRELCKQPVNQGSLSETLREYLYGKYIEDRLSLEPAGSE